MSLRNSYRKDSHKKVSISPETLSSIHSYPKRLRERPKQFYWVPGPGLSTGGDDFFQCTERGEYFFGMENGGEVKDSKIMNEITWTSTLSV